MSVWGGSKWQGVRCGHCCCIAAVGCRACSLLSRYQLAASCRWQMRADCTFPFFFCFFFIVRKGLNVLWRPTERRTESGQGTGIAKKKNEYKTVARHADRCSYRPSYTAVYPVCDTGHSFPIPCALCRLFVELIAELHSFGVALLFS